MNLKECYLKFGGDYDEVVGRLRREQLVTKFFLKFLDDKSFELYEEAMARKDYDEALRAVHTLKGICQNLGFTRLYHSSVQINNALRENDVGTAIRLSDQLSMDYHLLIEAAQEFKASMEG